MLKKKKTKARKIVDLAPALSPEVSIKDVEKRELDLATSPRLAIETSAEIVVEGEVFKLDLGQLDIDWLG